MKIVIAILALIILVLQVRLWTGAGSYAQLNQLSGEIEAQKEENARLEARNEQLYAEINELKTGLDAVEEHARSELGMIREGETFYMIIDDKQPQAASDSATANSASPEQ